MIDCSLRAQVNKIDMPLLHGLGTITPYFLLRQLFASQTGIHRAHSTSKQQISVGCVGTSWYYISSTLSDRAGCCSVGYQLPLQTFPSMQPGAARILPHCTYTTTYNSLDASVARRRPVAQPSTKGLHCDRSDAMSSRTSVSAPAPERVRKRVAEACAFCRRRKVCPSPTHSIMPNQP